MRKGKPEFSETETAPDEEAADYSFTPGEDAYLAPYQDRRRDEYFRERKRIEPRASDEVYDRSVSRLFGNVIPGLPIDRDAPQLRVPVTPFAQIIEQTLKRLDLKASPFLDSLAENWARILPPDIARDTRPAKLDKGILYVAVSTHTQLFELRRTAHAIIKQAVLTFAKAQGISVRDIHLMVDTGG